MKRAAVSRPQAIDARAKIKLVAGDELANALADLRQSIARRAYEFYQKRGDTPGQEFEDWTRAETEFMRPLPGNMTDSGDYITLRGFVPDCNIARIGFEPHRILVWTEEAAGSGQAVASPVLTFDLSEPVDLFGSSADRVGQVLTVKMAKAAPGGEAKPTEGPRRRAAGQS
ncbi:MAG: DUF2934 domain-containing protein [Terriglobia bacterium]